MLSCSGIRYSRTSTNCFGLWTVAFYGTCIGNCPNLHPGWFLLLLYQEVDDKFSLHSTYLLICCCKLSDSFSLWLQPCWGTTCSSSSFGSGVILTFIFSSLKLGSPYALCAEVRVLFEVRCVIYLGHRWQRSECNIYVTQSQTFNVLKFSYFFSLKSRFHLFPLFPPLTVSPGGLWL